MVEYFADERNRAASDRALGATSAAPVGDLPRAKTAEDAGTTLARNLYFAAALDLTHPPKAVCLNV
jgi:hypothetical protein